MGAGNEKMTMMSGGVVVDNAAARAVSYAEMDGDEATRCAAVLRAIESGELDDVTSLDVSNCGLEELPESVGRLRRLEFLNAGGNRLRSLPASVERLTNLKRAFFLANAFEEVPEVLVPLLRLPLLHRNSIRSHHRNLRHLQIQSLLLVLQTILPRLYL